jgi:hypothetical protein
MYARTPFTTQVSEAGQTGGKIELFLSNTSTFPATPTYILERTTQVQRITLLDST